MITSAIGLTFIRTKETLALTAYKKKGDVWTIGWGHTGSDVHEGLVITVEKAMELFRRDVSKHENEVNRLVKVPLNQCMFDALVSFDFNCGGLEFVDKQTNMPIPSRTLISLNQRRYNDVVEELIKWNMMGGDDVRGLLIRRLEEGLMFARDKYPA